MESSLSVDFGPIIRQYHDAILSKDADLLADLYEEDAVHELPFTHDPRVCLRGRDAIREQYKAAWAATPVVITSIVNVVTHRMADPELAVCEFDMHARAEAAQHEFTASCVLIMRIRNGQLVYVRDYIDAMTIAQALGTVPLGG